MSVHAKYVQTYEYLENNTNTLKKNSSDLYAFLSFSTQEKEYKLIAEFKKSY